LDVFANAGVGQPIPLGSITEEHFDKTFNTNVKVYFHCAEGTATDARGASIILNASTASIVGTPAFSVYGATAAVFARTGHSTLRTQIG